MLGLHQDLRRSALSLRLTAHDLDLPPAAPYSLEHYVRRSTCNEDPLSSLEGPANRMNRFWIAPPAFAMVLTLLPTGCQSQTQTQTREPGASTANPDASASALEPALAPRRDNCSVDDECVLFNGENERVGMAGGPVGCCLGGAIPYVRAANKDWLAQLEKFCSARPQGLCPGGNGPPVRPACHAGHCVPACQDEVPCQYYRR